MRTKLRTFGITVIAFFMLLTTIFAVTGAGIFIKAENAEQSVVNFSAVDALRTETDVNGWSVATFDGTTISEIQSSTSIDYTYYTTWVQEGVGYSKDGAMAFVPNKLIHNVAADCNGPDESMVNSQKYSVVLKNDETNKMALVYTAGVEGTIYYQDLAQVAPLHYDEKDNAGVYGEYRIVKLSAQGTVTQLYPEQGNHELFASNGAPTTSAYVNSSVEMAVGDKLVFVSEKASSEIYSSPVVSYTEFEEVYEFKNFWKWQQINDANYFDVVYKNPNGEWQSFPNLETKHANYDIYNRSGAPYTAALYWTTDYTYSFAYGGLWVHAGEVPSTEGLGDVGYAFKVPHSGYVNIDFEMLGHYQPGLAVYHNENRIYYMTAEDGANVFHYGLNWSQNALYVEQGDILYFVETSERGPATVDINPIITYIDDPYTINKTELELDNGAEETLTLTLNDSDFAVSADDVVWSVANEGIVTLTHNGATVTVKGVSVGQTVISAKIGDYAQVSCAVTVNAVSRFTVQSQTVSVEEGKTADISVTITDSSFTADKLSVMVEDDTIATATISDTTITITGVSEGTCELYIQGENSISVTIEITVTEKQQSGGETPGGNTPGGETPGGETPEKPEEKSGCGSTVVYTGFILGAVAVLFVSFIMLKKKNTLKD